jgi:kynurenine formamidase
MPTQGDKRGVIEELLKRWSYLGGEGARLLRVPTTRRAYLTALPILLQGCGGAPVRAVAWEFEE